MTYTSIKTIIDQHIVNTVIIDDTTYYYVSDLVKIYGRSFISRLSKPTRLENISGRQFARKRQLVEAADFTRVINKLKEQGNFTQHGSLTAKDLDIKHSEEAQVLLDFKSSTKANCGNTRMLKDLEITPEDIYTEEEDTSTTIRDRIVKLILDYTATTLRTEGLGKENSATDKAKLIRISAYKALYRKFDQVMGRKIKAERNQTLEDYGLGYSSRKGVKKHYMDTIAEAGCLPQLEIIAEALFGASRQNNK